jgi:hypothetical protein
MHIARWCTDRRVHVYCVRASDRASVRGCVRECVCSSVRASCVHVYLCVLFCYVRGRARAVFCMFRAGPPSPMHARAQVLIALAASASSHIGTASTLASQLVGKDGERRRRGAPRVTARRLRIAVSNRCAAASPSHQTTSETGRKRGGDDLLSEKSTPREHP